MSAVTNHALLRFLERACHADVDSARRQLRQAGSAGTDLDVLNELAVEYDLAVARRALDEIAARAIATGASAVCVHGLRYVMQGSALVTVCPIKSPPSRAIKERHND